MKTIKKTKIIYERSAEHINDKYRKITEIIDGGNETLLVLHNIEESELFILKRNGKYIIRIKDNYKYRSNHFIDTLYLNKIMTHKNIPIELISFVFSDKKDNKNDKLKVVILKKKHRKIYLNCHSSRMLVIGSNDEDIISGSKQKDIIYGYSGSDDIDGGDGQDVIEAGDGDDFISGGDGNDHLYGDVIYGDKGADSVVGGFGADLIQGGDQKDYIEGNAGNDYISGDADNDYLFGGDGDDLIFGGDGDDLLEGDAEYYTQENEENNNSGNDHLFAGNGDDTLIAGKGNDFLDGGKGDDLYYFNIGDGTNIINEISEGNNTIHFDEHLISELTMTRHGSHFLFSSRKKGDNLRVLVKDQLSENGPKIQWLVTKKNPESTEPEFRIKIPNFVSEQSPDRGDIIDPDIADMLINEYIYGIKKISSTFNPKMKSNSTKDNLDMLVAAISLQDKWTLAGDMDYDFIPKNVVSYVTLLNAQYTHIHG